ncbi:hypothetical protein [Nocardioides sp. B-3]|uniref:hypothetical protein n=1 Tax=Nocardioides sp. B-3 TaxID=2895565 RepID=UPI003FA54541
MYALLHWYNREPRVVLKDTSAWDPAIDVLLNRIPASFISPNPGPGEEFETKIARLASGLDANDAFVIFPEGGTSPPNGVTARSHGCASSGWRRWPSGPSG